MIENFSNILSSMVQDLAHHDIRRAELEKSMADREKIEAWNKLQKSDAMRWAKLNGSMKAFCLYLQELSERPAPPVALLNEPEVWAVIQADAKEKLQKLC